MFHSAGYRLTFHPAHVFCPLCTLPGNSRVPLQPCCRYQGEVCPQSHIELPACPVNSLMALRSHSYGFPAESLNMPSFSLHHLHSSTADISHTQPARTSGEDISSNNGRWKRGVLKIRTLSLISLRFTITVKHFNIL